MELYKFKKLLFNDGFLNNSVDATYIIHLENNGRYEHIQKQLSEYHPTNIVYILFNKGYKKSIKKPFINKPALDLIDAFLEIFKHANKKKYNNILILEDDFIFSKKIKNKEHQNNINNTINNFKDINFMYLLGSIPLILIPFNLYNYRSLSRGTHSVIYSKQNRIKTLEINQEKINDWDVFNDNIFNKYTYHMPLVYQIFPETENSKCFIPKDKFNKFIYYNLNIQLFLNKFLKLDKLPEPGTTIIYNASKILSCIFLFVFFYLIYRLYKKINIFK